MARQKILAASMWLLVVGSVLPFTVGTAVSQEATRAREVAPPVIVDVTYTRNERNGRWRYYDYTIRYDFESLPAECQSRWIKFSLDVAMDNDESVVYIQEDKGLYSYPKVYPDGDVDQSEATYNGGSLPHSYMESNGSVHVIKDVLVQGLLNTGQFPEYTYIWADVLYTGRLRCWSRISNVSRLPGPTRADEPDLVVQSPRASASSVEPEEAFTFSATVRNAGGAAAAATTLRYQRRSRGGFSWTAVGTAGIAGLPPSVTSFQSIVLEAPAQPGAYDYRACVDAVSGESDRGNNCSDPVGVTVSSGEADLVVESPTVSPGSVGPGEEFTFSATVRNVGSVAAAATTLRYEHRSGGVSWTQVGTAAVAGVPPSVTSFQSIVLEAPTQAGTHN